MITYQKCKVAAEHLRDENMCTVIALACTKQITYERAYAICQEHGRKHGKGMMPTQVVKMLGTTTDDWHSAREYFGKRVTAKTFAKLMPRGKYFCLTRNHAIAIVNGVVQDWTKDRKHQIRFFYRVG